MKNHKYLNLISLMLCTLIMAIGLNTSFGQSMTSLEMIPVQLRNSQFNLNILQPSLSFEKKVSDNKSLSMAAGIRMLPSTESEYETDFLYSVNPFIQADFQHYYKRKRVKKQLRSNSGNFIGVSTGYTFDSIADNLEFGTTEQSNSFVVGPVWGIQRNYDSGIHLKLSLGPGVGFGENSDVFMAGVGGFEFGFVLN